MKEALGTLPQPSMVLDLWMNCIGGLFSRPLFWIEWTFVNLFLALNLLVLRLRPREDSSSRFRYSRTSLRSEFLSTLSFCVVLLSLFTMRVSILLRLWITFSCILAVLNSLMTLFTWEFFL